MTGRAGYGFSICIQYSEELHIEKRLLITTWQSVGRPKSYYVLQKITLMALLSIRRERQICDERILLAWEHDQIAVDTFFLQ